MTTILAVDTSTEACSVALRVGSRTIARYTSEPRSHSRLVMPMVQAILSEAQLKVQQLDAIGVTIGPGSFTGLRIGFAAVQGLAYGIDVPVVPVSTLKLMAATYLRLHCPPSENLENREIIALLDARMSEYNLGHYAVGKGSIVALKSDQLVSAEQALSALASGSPATVVGEAQKLIETDATLADKFIQLYPQAEDILPIAQAEYTQGRGISVNDIDLTYLRGADAWQKRKRLRKV